MTTMGSVHPDPSELLAKALDLAVSGVALARYAAEHTGDRRLRRTFQRVAATSEAQARLLRERLAERAGMGQPSPPRAELAAQFVAGAVLATAAVAIAMLVYRVLTAPPDDPLRRVMTGAFRGR